MGFKEELKKTLKEKIAENKATAKENKRTELHKSMQECALKGQPILQIRNFDDITEEILTEEGFTWKFVPDTSDELYSCDTWDVDLLGD